MAASLQFEQHRERFFVALYRLVQMARIHQDNNQVLIECAQTFLTLLGGMSAAGEAVNVQVLHGRLYLQDERLGYHRETAVLIQNMVQFFQARRIEGLRFRPAGTASPGTVLQVIAAARLLHAAGRQGDPPGWLAERLGRDAGALVDVLTSEPPAPDPDAGLSEGERQQRARHRRMRRTYACALHSVQEVAGRIGTRQRAGARKTIRIVQNMVDLIMADEPVLLGLSTIRDYDDYTFSHCVNVAILSMYTGRRIGLSRTALERLGVCGLFHDLGKVDIPREVLNKPGRLTAEEFVQVQKHPENSVRHIIRLQASRELKSRIILPPYEHHLRYDLSGYPRTHRRKPMGFFSRILALADAFDAMTTPRPYHPEPYSPDRALVLMLHGSGRYFDPVLLKVFIGMLGLYPVGTLLLLDTGETGLVAQAPEDSDGSLPEVLLLRKDAGGGYVRGHLVSLTATDAEGRPLRRVVKSMHPAVCGIQPAEYLYPQ